MPKGGQAPSGGSSKFGNSTNPVADDRNWVILEWIVLLVFNQVGRVQNELTCVAAWNRDWGFLAGDSENLKMEDATKPYNIEEQIQKVQEVTGILNGGG
jgi:hypothetical protein